MNVAIKSTLNQLVRNKNDINDFEIITNYFNPLTIFAFSLQALFVKIHFGIRDKDKEVMERYKDFIKAFKRLDFTANSDIDIFNDNVSEYFFRTVIGSYQKYNDLSEENNVKLFQTLLNKIYIMDIKNDYLDKINGHKFIGVYTFIPPLARLMTTCTRTNIREHYKEYISRLINIIFLKSNPKIQETLSNLNKDLKMEHS